MYTFNLISDPQGVDSISALEDMIVRRVSGEVRWIPAHPAVLGLVRALYHGPFNLPLCGGFQVAFLFDGEEA